MGRPGPACRRRRPVPAHPDCRRRRRCPRPAAAAGTRLTRGRQTRGVTAPPRAPSTLRAPSSATGERSQPGGGAAAVPLAPPPAAAQRAAGRRCCCHLSAQTLACRGVARLATAPQPALAVLICCCCCRYYEPVRELFRTTLGQVRPSSILTPAHGGTGLAACSGSWGPTVCPLRRRRHGVPAAAPASRAAGGGRPPRPPGCAARPCLTPVLPPPAARPQAQVYLARNKETGQEVVIKMIERGPAVSKHVESELLIHRRARGGAAVDAACW